MSVDSLGDRMKEYEAVPQNRLMRRAPVIVRADGKAFHTFTRGMEKPYDRKLQMSMWAAASYMCQNMQGAKIAYVQSDEISVLLTDYATPTTDGWFDYQVQKVVSVAASLATAGFNSEFQKQFPGQDKVAIFDARAYNLPIHEANNYMIWRQNDATRNSISGLAQANFSHKQLHGVDTGKMQDMLFKEKGINWNDCPVEQKRGVCVKRVTREIESLDRITGETRKSTRSSWDVDLDIPIFSKDREYIDRLVAPPKTNET